MSKSTMVELVQELEKLPQNADIKAMIEEAKAGEYHDYKNKKYPCGKIAAYNKLYDLGHTELADRISDGEFDEQADDEDKAMMAKELGDDPFSSELSKMLGLV